MSLLHPKFLKPVASSPNQVVRLPCHVFGLFYLLCLLDTLLLRFLQSSPNDQESDLGASGILHTLDMLDGSLLTTRFLQISTSLFMVRLDNIFRYELNALLSQKPHLLCPSSFTAAGLTLLIFFLMLKNSIPSPFSQKMSYLSVLKTFSILQSATNTFSFLYKWNSEFFLI